MLFSVTVVKHLQEVLIYSWILMVYLQGDKPGEPLGSHSASLVPPPFCIQLRNSIISPSSVNCSSLFPANHKLKSCCPPKPELYRPVMDQSETPFFLGGAVSLSLQLFNVHSLCCTRIPWLCPCRTPAKFHDRDPDL